MLTSNSQRIGRRAEKVFNSVCPDTIELEVMTGLVKPDYGIDYTLQFAEFGEVKRSLAFVQLKGCEEKLIPGKNGKISFALSDAQYKKFLSVHENGIALIVVDNLGQTNSNDITVYYTARIQPDKQIVVYLNPEHTLTNNLESWNQFMEEVEKERIKLASEKVTVQDRLHYKKGEFEKILSHKVPLDNGYFIEKEKANVLALKHTDPNHEMEFKVSAKIEDGGPDFDLAFNITRDGVMPHGGDINEGDIMYMQFGITIHLQIKDILSGKFGLYEGTICSFSNEKGSYVRVKSTPQSPVKYELYSPDNVKLQFIDCEKLVDLGYGKDLLLTVMAEKTMHDFGEIKIY